MDRGSPSLDTEPAKALGSEANSQAVRRRGAVRSRRARLSHKGVATVGLGPAAVLLAYVLAVVLSGDGLADSVRTAGAASGRGRVLAPLEPPAASAAMDSPPPQTVELSLPFDGTWGVVQGFDSGHTHIGYATYALDFVPAERIDPTVPRKRARNLAEFACYGRPVLAPADGKVVWARDGARDLQPWTRAQYDPGNFVIIEHGEAQYTELRHLKRGSVRVAVGQQVRRGQVVASCGNSGMATAPHLHLGLLGSASPIATRPMRFSHYEVLATDGSWFPGDGTLRKGEILRSVP